MASIAFQPVPFTSVTLDDEFWAPRQRVNRERTISHEYEQLQKTGRINAFRLEWKPGDESVPHIFWDSDVAKWLEAASDALAIHSDPLLAEQVEQLVTLIASAQQPDGYLNTHFTVVEPDKRWTNLRDKHELYCAGHLIEAGVAHYRATGERTLLDVVCRYADHIASVFGPADGQRRGYPGHPEIELALVKLYRTTRERRYLDLSAYFVNERGRQPHYYDVEARRRGEDPAAFWAKTYAYNQSQMPVRDQTRVAGHAVRAMYLYSAMADLSKELGDETLFETCKRLSEHLTSRNLYITGGIGPSGSNEGFGQDYDLPNETAYAETCAAIGLVFWSHRLLQLSLDRRYSDVMERALCNGVLSGVSLSGDRFFYENPLASDGTFQRQEWFDCACCPPNLARLIASLGEYIYSTRDDAIAVHLYVQGQAQVHVAGQIVRLRQETRYPWEGRIAIGVEPEAPVQFSLCLRLPGWCRTPSVTVNGSTVDLVQSAGGYARIERVWRSGDRVLLDLPMPIERIYAHPNIKQNAGLVALQRGPLVYCAEQVDQQVPLEQILLPVTTPLSAEWGSDRLGGVVSISGRALRFNLDDWDGVLYRPMRSRMDTTPVKLIPYFAWGNRSAGPMRVWLPEASSAG